MANDSKIGVKEEPIDPNLLQKPTPNPQFTGPTIVIDLSSSDSDDSDSDSSSDEIGGNKRPRDYSGCDNAAKKSKKMAEDLPVGFLDPLPSKKLALIPVQSTASVVEAGCKQFWKAGDYEGTPAADWDFTNGGMDRVRVHPKFLHSNATSHKWVLGAFAELLDNSLDEVCNGATYVNIDMVKSKKDGSKMLLIEDDGGGMDPDKMRHCMSLGYSAKSKMVNTIGQYGNGFKTSTMRLGADVIVFSRCCGKDGRRFTSSIKTYLLVILYALNS